MRNVIKESTAETIRLRLEFLRTHHHAAMRSADERLRAAMLEYQQSACPQWEQTAA